MDCKTGKRAFAYQKAAEKEAVRIRKRSNTRLIPYRCQHCSQYHLTTAGERGEPFRKRGWGRDEDKLESYVA